MFAFASFAWLEWRADTRCAGAETEGIARAGVKEHTRASNGWHADITFEKVPSDYAVSLDWPLYFRIRASDSHR